MAKAESSSFENELVFASWRILCGRRKQLNKYNVMLNEEIMKRLKERKVNINYINNENNNRNLNDKYRK